MYWKFASVLVLNYLNELATNSIVTQGTCGIAVAFYRLGSLLEVGILMSPSVSGESFGLNWSNLVFPSPTGYML